LADTVDPYDFALAFFIAALAPSVLYLFFVLTRNRSGVLPLRKVLSMFVFGASSFAVYAIVLEGIVIILLSSLQLATPLMSSLVVAPLIEEALKPLPVWRLGRKALAEVDDGVVYGVASGLGFAATENLILEFQALLGGGMAEWLRLSAIRSVSSTLIHPAATGLVGWMIGKMSVERKGVSWVLLGYFGASLLHSLHNYLAVDFWWASVFLAVSVFALVVRRVR